MSTDDRDFYFGRDFGTAACDVLGLDPRRVSGIDVDTGLNDVLSLRVTLMVDAHDLELIAQRMKALRGEKP